MTVSDGAVSKPVRSAATLRKRLGCLSSAQLTDMLLELVEIPKLQQHLPTPDVDEMKAALVKATCAVRHALPNSRFGSTTDEYGFKRARTANSALKKLVSEIIRRADSSADPACMLSVVDFLFVHLREEAVRFDNPKHNEWMDGALKKISATTVRASKLMVKDKNASTQDLVAVSEKFATIAPDIKPVVEAAIAKRKSKDDKQ